jgi:sec-independent protein translocase protein TatA
MPLGLHWPELIILVGVALLIFGPKRLPEMGSSVAKTIKEFQRSMREITDEGNHAEPPAIPPPITTQAKIDEADRPAGISSPQGVEAPAESTAE